MRLLGELEPQLAKLERYEPRALLRRKVAVRIFDAGMDDRELEPPICLPRLNLAVSAHGGRRK
jgi:hypothetical protein